MTEAGKIMMRAFQNEFPMEGGFDAAKSRQAVSVASQALRYVDQTARKNLTPLTVGELQSILRLLDDLVSVTADVLDQTSGHVNERQIDTHPERRVFTPQERSRLVRSEALCMNARNAVVTAQHELHESEAELRKIGPERDRDERTGAR